MRKFLTVLLVLITMGAWQGSVVAQTLEDDVNAIRKFLTDNLDNVTALGLSGNSWQNNTKWVNPSNGLTISGGRIVKIDWTTKPAHKAIKGDLDLKKLTALNYLNLNSTKVTSVDVSGIASLKYLYCDAELSSLVLSGNINLEEINCSGNAIKTLNLVGLVALKSLNCSSNSLTSINVLGNTNLITLRCSYNDLESLVINPELTTLVCDNNFLTPNTPLPMPSSELTTYIYTPQKEVSAYVSGPKLDLTKYHVLKNVYSFEGNKDPLLNTPISNNTDGYIVLPLLDLGNSSLKCKITNEDYPDFASNPIVVNITSAPLYQPEVDHITDLLGGGSFDPDGIDWGIEKNGVLRITSIKWTNKGIAKPVSFPGFDYLETLWVDQNSIPSLDVSGAPKLTYLNCSDNKVVLPLVDVSSNPDLKTLECSNSNLSTLKLGATSVETIDCSNNKLTTLDISTSTSLTTLNCSNNQLQELNINSNGSLTTLDCSNNQISTLAPSNSALVTLDCSGNNMTSLVLNDLGGLQYLTCSGNNFSSFSPVSGSLITLDCSDSKINTLDVAVLHNLETLKCNDNNLSVLDVSGNMKLQNLYCQNNKLWFSELPSDSFAGTYEYAPQQDPTPISVHGGATVDITAFGGIAVWYKKADMSTPLVNITASTPGKYLIPISYVLPGSNNELVCVITNPTHAMLTLAYNVSVLPKNTPPPTTEVPEITGSLEQLGEIALCPGTNYTLGVTATGGGLSYTWTLNGKQIDSDPGYPNRVTIISASAVNVGTYSVKVTNSKGSKVSTTTVLVKGTVPTKVSIKGLPKNPETNKTYEIIATKVDGAEYIWSYSNGEIDIIKTKDNNIVNIVFKKVGKGKLSLTVNTGCGGANSSGSFTYDELDVIQGQITGIEEVSNRNLVVYPNPVDAELQIKSDDVIRKVTVVSMSGSRVFAQQGLNVTEFSINASDWAKGNTYIVTVETDKGVSAHKVIKK